MNRILIPIFLILLISSINITSAEQIEEWPHGQRNAMPDDIEGVRYDFEEGSNCGDFNNQYPEIATFLTVLGGNVPTGYGPNYPSYSSVGGSMCGDTRCYMNIWPYHGWENATFIVNGNVGFNSITCCECDTCWTGECYPGTEARIQFKEGTHYISFLASTGGNLYIRLYDMKGSQYNQVHYEKITVNIDRVNDDPSNFTHFSIHLPNIDIARMDIRGSFNGWHIDDLIIGGAPGYLPDRPVDYSDVAEKAKTLVGEIEYHVDYLEHGFGFDYRDFTYADAEDLIYPPSNCAPGLNCPTGLEYWNPDIKQFVYGEGISDEGLIIWAYNSITTELYGESVVKWETVPDMIKHDFTEPVPIGEEQPGDVYVMYGGDYGALDEIGIVVDDDYVVTSRPDDGVIYVFKPMIEGVDTPNPDFAGYYRLPGKITGGHNPIKKHPPNK